MRQHVGGAGRNDAKPRTGPVQSIGDLGNCTVAAGRNQQRFATAYRLARQFLRVPGMLRFRKVWPAPVRRQNIQHTP